MKSLFEIGVRLIGLLVICWTIPPLFRILTVLLPPFYHGSFNKIVFPSISIILQMFFGFCLLKNPNIVTNISNFSENETTVNITKMNSLLQIGFILIGLYCFIDTMVDLGSGLFGYSFNKDLHPIYSSIIIKSLIGNIISIFIIIKSKPIIEFIFDNRNAVDISPMNSLLQIGFILIGLYYFIDATKDVGSGLFGYLFRNKELFSLHFIILIKALLEGIISIFIIMKSKSIISIITK